jgi:hypothetical protein
MIVPLGRRTRIKAKVEKLMSQNIAMSRDKEYNFITRSKRGDSFTQT